MRIIYLIQAESDQLPYHLSNETDFLILNWRHGGKDDTNVIHLPNSSWAEGRNRLFQAALDRGRFDYYVFCDDDLELLFDLESFHDLLDEFKPARGVPHYRANIYGDASESGIASGFKYVDHCMMAISHEAASRIFPYTTRFDTSCWWLTSEDFCARTHDVFPCQSLRFNQLVVNNLKARPYPRQGYPGLPCNPSLEVTSPATASMLNM